MDQQKRMLDHQKSYIWWTSITMNSVKEPKEIFQNWLKIRAVTISWNKPSKDQVEEKLIKRKVNMVFSFVGNLIENIFTITSVSAET